MNTPKMFSSKLLTPIGARQAGQRYASQKQGHARKATYNDVPSPSGSYQKNADAQTRRYNIQLAASIVTFVGTIVLGKVCGLLNLYNEFPERPATIESYKTEDSDHSWS